MPVNFDPCIQPETIFTIDEEEQKRSCFKEYFVYDEEMSVGMSGDLDVIEALKALGYDANEARDSLKKIDKNISDTAQKIKAALKVLN